MAKRIVLIVDDDPTIRKMLAELLTLEGYPIETASGGAEALAILERGEPRVVILDLRMDPIAGWDVMAALQANGKRSQHRIIFMSADPWLEQYRHLNPDAELAKPFSTTQILDLIEKHAA